MHSEPTSIWNEYGNYGGEYSNLSPFNSYSNTPPVIVDKDGNFYGYLTTNVYKKDRAEFSLAFNICRFWKDIKEDVGAWYEKYSANKKLRFTRIQIPAAQTLTPFFLFVFFRLPLR